ncbi:MAG: hypothetical protein R3F38_04820 [Gammaproteobacteria bacterium]
MLDRSVKALLACVGASIGDINDRNSYGFRPMRSTADAIEQCFVNLSRKNSAQWVLKEYQGV